MAQQDEVHAAVTASGDLEPRKMLYMGMARCPAASLDLFRKRCASLCHGTTKPQDMLKLEVQISVFGVQATHFQDGSDFLAVSIMSIKYVAVQANILLFFAKDSTARGELPNFSVHALLCEGPAAAIAAGKELTQACLTVHTGFREIKRTVDESQVAAAMRLSFTGESTDVDRRESRIAGAISSLSLGGELTEVEKFGFGDEFDFQSEAQLGEYMQTHAQQDAGEEDYFDPASLRSPEMKKMLSGKVKADATFIRGLSRHMSKRHVSFSGGLVLSPAAQATIKRAQKVVLSR